jgi:glucuronoarabinoxylan endo-1,4-beta-xylanase
MSVSVRLRCHLLGLVVVNHDRAPPIPRRAQKDLRQPRKTLDEQHPASFFWPRGQCHPTGVNFGPAIAPRASDHWFMLRLLCPCFLRPLVAAPPGRRSASRCTGNLSLTVAFAAALGCEDPTGFAPPTAPNSEASSSRVAVVPSRRFQTLEGFGASIAWYGDVLLTHPAKGEIFALIFQQLGLDILRFRNRYQRSTEAVDLNQERAILAGATASLGRAPRVVLTSWSPPAELKASGAENCTGGDDATCTLRRVNGEFDYAGFAAYWSDSLEYYAGYGIVPDFISLQNEPDFVPTSWEGCRFNPTEDSAYPSYARALQLVSERQNASSVRPVLLGPETLGVHYGRAARYLEALDRNLLYGAAHHLYEQGSDGVWDWRTPGPDSYLGPMSSVPAAAGWLPIFQTEFQTDEDQSIEGGFETAWLIHNSLEQEGTAAFLYWDLVWRTQRATDHGLVSLSGDTFAVRDQYYALRHYSGFTDPGHVRILAESNACAIRATAFLAPDERQIIVVLLNLGSTDDAVTLDWEDFDARSSEVHRTVFRPGASERWTPLGSIADDHSVSLPSRSVATVVLRQ